MPQFTPEDVAKLIKAKRPSLVIGVPTLYDALNRSRCFCGTDLSCLKAAFCGADTLPRAVKERFEEIVRSQGGDIQLREVAFNVLAQEEIEMRKEKGEYTGS